MSIFETSRKMKPNEEMCFEMGREFGKQEAAPKWISINERLPEAMRDVLVFHKGWEFPHGIIGIDYCRDDGNWSNDCLEVTHWMPLPDEPKEADAE